MQKIPLITKVVFLHICLVFVFSGIKALGTKLPPAQALTYTATKSPEKAKPIVISGEPLRLKIPRLNIDLPVIDGVYDSVSKTWTLTDDSIQFARSTALPSNSAGNTFLYGHNTPAVLGKTIGIQPGDELILETKNNKTFVYKYRMDRITTPNDTSVFSAEYDSPVLTLLTCSGFWSQDRRLMYFEFMEIR